MCNVMCQQLFYFMSEWMAFQMLKSQENTPIIPASGFVLEETS